MSLPNMTKEICNGWKSDSIIASIVLSSQIHAITSQLHDWNSSRIAQDDVISKPHSGGTAVQFHRDGSYISDQFSPTNNNSITVWLPLDDVKLTSGTIEYISQSHKWKDIKKNQFNFHSSNNSSCHRTNFLQSIDFNPNNNPNSQQQYGNEIEFHYVEVPSGGVAFHHQNTFHGSGSNNTNNQMRRALVIHTLNGDCKFHSERKPSYIYGRYQLQESYKTNSGEIEMKPINDLQETFYPLCWDSKLPRSKWLQRYCNDLTSEELFQYEDEKDVEDE